MRPRALVMRWVRYVATFEYHRRQVVSHLSRSWGFQDVGTTAGRRLWSTESTTIGKILARAPRQLTFGRASSGSYCCATLHRGVRVEAFC
jgi:hypothetical protein